MRVTDNYKFESFKNSILYIQKKLQRTQDQVSAQKKILKPSDDPVGTAQYMQLTVQQGRNDQYVKNIDRLTTISGMTETSLNSISDILTQAKQLATEMSSDTVTGDTRAAMVSEVEGYINQLATIGNTSISGTYIFGGKKTNAAPYTVSSTYDVTYSGTADVPKVNVAPGQTVNLGVSGETLFGPVATGMFSALQGLRNGLKSNKLSDIQNALTTIDAAVDLNANNISAVGAYSKNLDSLSQITDDNTLQIKTNISELMDVDMVSALSDYNTLSTAYEMALSVMGKMQSLSILNYIK